MACRPSSRCRQQAWRSASCISTLLGRVLMTTLCRELALGQGECQKFVAGGHLSGLDMRILCRGHWTSGHHALPPYAELGTCSTAADRRDGHAHSWHRGWTCSTDAGRPEGHAHSLSRPVEIKEIGPVLTPTDGNAQRLRWPQGTCPRLQVGRGSRRAKGGSPGDHASF